jgi:hypothetical protein
MTHFFANMRDEKAEDLKKLLWKIQDEFIAMNYEGWENLEMRWSAGCILAAQEHLTVVADLDGDGNTAEMRTVGWMEFQKKYKPTPVPEDGTDVSAGLKELFEWYEMEFQSAIYRRFKSLYSTTWAGKSNPRDFEKMHKEPTDAEKIDLEVEQERTKKAQKRIALGRDEEQIKAEQKNIAFDAEEERNNARKKGIALEAREEKSKNSRRKTPTSASWCQTTASADSSTYLATLSNCWTRS